MGGTVLLFDKSLRKIEYLFRWSGMHLRNREEYNEAVKGESLISLTYSAPTLTLGILSVLKSASFMWYYDCVDKLVYKLRQLETKADFNSTTNKALVEEPVNFLNFVIKVSNLFNWLLLVAFPLMPLATTAYNYFILNKTELMLPFLVEYPFDPFNIKVYPFVVIDHIWGAMVALFWIFASESFYYICTTFIVVQFKLLQQNILQIIPENSDSVVRNEDVVFHTKLVELVEWHQDLIEAVKLIETIYSKSTLFNFVSSSAIICLTGFNVTTIDDLAFVVMFLTFLCLSLTQIFFLCFFGDIIMRSNKEVGDAVYNCNWYMTSAKNAKMLHYLQLRAQKPCKLTAYGFADVNVNAFSKIMNSAWSYFALLKTVDR
ncbi:odorant receptor 4-like [Hyposmocoma kahamanoa]|uniref:odorant receptor 4-like n=1 Tax=Hyposmocoma kahamanoa TaxID=1477025 RepID=UPI000E6D7B8F|nr:odorant receptor 4-like [Hyposmocoma kahamanoa]